MSELNFTDEQYAKAIRKSVGIEKTLLGMAWTETRGHVVTAATVSHLTGVPIVQTESEIEQLVREGKVTAA